MNDGAADMSNSAHDMVKDQIEKLRVAAEGNKGIRLDALLAAVDDSRVIDVLASRIGEGFFYNGALITVREDRVSVLFSFARRPGEFGLVPPSFLAVVDVEERRVTRLMHNYSDASEISVTEPGSLQPGLELRHWLQPDSRARMMRNDGGVPNASGLSTWI